MERKYTYSDAKEFNTLRFGEGVRTDLVWQMDQTLFLQGAYTASDNALREKVVWLCETSFSISLS